MTNPNYTRHELGLVKFVAPLANAGAGLTWSGLPLLLANETHDVGNALVLAISSGAASAIFTLAGGVAADSISRKRLVVSVFFLDALLTLALARFGSGDNLLLFYAVGFGSSLLGASISSAVATWAKDILAQSPEPLSRSLAMRGMWSIMAKTLGFSVGPFVFTSLQFDALYVDAALSLIPALCFLIVRDLKGAPRKGRERFLSYGDLLQRRFWNSERRLILLLYGLTASYVVPATVLSYAILLQRYGSGAVHASTFWLLASLGSIASRFVMTRRFFDGFSGFRRLIWSQSIMACGFAGLWVAPSSAWFAAAFVLFTLSNPVLSNVLETDVYLRCEEAFRGRFQAVCNLADSLAGLAVLVLCKELMEWKVADRFFLWSLPLMMASLLIVARHRATLSRPEPGRARPFPE